MASALVIGLKAEVEPEERDEQNECGGVKNLCHGKKNISAN
jgi:hypothetical protein